MNQIIMQKCDDGAIWTTSDEDQNGSDTFFIGEVEEKSQFVIALADFLELSPKDLIRIVYEIMDMEDEE